MSCNEGGVLELQRKIEEKVLILLARMNKHMLVLLIEINL